MKISPAIKTLGEVCEVIAGQSPEGRFYNTSGEGMPFYQGKKDFGERFVDEPTTWTTQTTKTAKADDILMSVRAPVGPVNITRNNICIGRGLAAIRAGSEIDRDFLYYQLLYLQPEISGKEGAVFASINKTDLQNLRLSVFLLKEQKRIVQKLDEAFAGIAKAKEYAEKNLQNARALFESYLQSVFTQRGTGWAERRLDEACVIIMGQSPDGETYNTRGEGLPLINGPVEFSSDSFGKTVRLKFTTKPTKLCKKDDLILCVRGSTTGRMNISGFDACIGRGVAAIRAKEYQPWINHFINAKRKEIYRLGTGATFPNVSCAILGGLKLSVPALFTQKEIVRTLDTLREATQRLAHLYGQKCEALDALKKSILHEAFSGNL